MVRRISAAVTLPVAAFAHAIGWYGIRSILVLWSSSVGLSAADISRMVTGMAVASLMGTVSSALVAAVIGPSATAAIGLAMAAVGCTAIGWLPPGWVIGAMLLAGAGVGLYRPAVFSAAALPFARSESGWVAALCIGVYLAVNAGATVASPLGAALYEAVPVAVGWTFGGALLAGAAAVGVDAVIQWITPEDRPEAAVVHNPTICVGAGVALLSALCAALYAVGGDARYERMAPAFDQVPALVQVNPLSVFTVGLLLIGAFVATALSGVRLSPPVVGGFGYALTGVFLLPLMVDVSALPLAIPLLVVGGAVEVASIAPSIAGAVGGIHWRLSTALAAIPLAASAMATLVASAARGFVPGWITIATTAASLALVGLLLACGSFLAERWLAERA